MFKNIFRDRNLTISICLNTNQYHFLYVYKCHLGQIRNTTASFRLLKPSFIQRTSGCFTLNLAKCLYVIASSSDPYLSPAILGKQQRSGSLSPFGVLGKGL